MPKRKAQVEEEPDSEEEFDSEEDFEDEGMMAAGGGFDEEEEDDDVSQFVCLSFSRVFSRSRSACLVLYFLMHSEHSGYIIAHHTRHAHNLAARGSDRVVLLSIDVTLSYIIFSSTKIDFFFYFASLPCSPPFLIFLSQELEAEIAALESSRQARGLSRPDKVHINNKAGLEASIQGVTTRALHHFIPPPLPFPLRSLKTRKKLELFAHWRAADSASAASPPKPKKTNNNKY